MNWVISQGNIMLARDKSHWWLAVIKFETVFSSSCCKRVPWMRLQTRPRVPWMTLQTTSSSCLPQLQLALKYVLWKHTISLRFYFIRITCMCMTSIKRGGGGWTSGLSTACLPLEENEHSNLCKNKTMMVMMITIMPKEQKNKCWFKRSRH